MPNNVSQLIDSYTQSNLRKLKQEESKTGRKFTKYDIAQIMLLEGKLTEKDFTSWMNTPEGFQNQTLTQMEKQALKSGNIWTFNQGISSTDEFYLDTFMDPVYVKDPITNVTVQTIPEESTAPSYAQNDTDIRQQTVNLLFSKAQIAQQMLTQYHNGIGYVSWDAFVQGVDVLGNVSWDSITDRNDFVTIFENEDAIQSELKILKELQDSTSKPKKFEKIFKDFYGVDFNPQKFKKLAESSKKLDELNIHSGLSKYFEQLINEVKNSSNEISLETLLHPVFGENNIVVTAEIINSLKAECNNDEELKQKLISILQKSKSAVDEHLKDYDRTSLEDDLKKSYKSAMGDYASNEVIAQYIAVKQNNAMLSEAVGTLALTYLTMGTSTTLQLSEKSKLIFGKTLGTQVFKGRMTAVTSSFAPIETIAGGLTSREGLTLDKGKEAFEELKNGLKYGSFATFVSGPLGNLVSKVLSKNPQIFSNIVASHKFSSMAGLSVETTADALFERITSDVSFKESMAQNGIMNFSMMFAGGLINKGAKLPDVNLSDIRIEKMKDGSFNLIANGKVFFKAKNANELTFVILSLKANKEALETKHSRITLEDSTLTIKTEDEFFTEFLKNETIKDLSGNEQSRFTQEEIETMVNAYKENPELVQDLLKERTIDFNGNNVPRFDSTDITQLVKASKVNPDLVQELLKVRMIDSNGNDVPRFDSEEIARLVNASKDNPDLVQDLLKEKMIDSNGNDVPRFRGFDINILVQVSKVNPDLVQELLKVRMIDSNGNNVPRFDSTDITQLVKASKVNPDLVQELLKVRMIDSNGNNVPRFDSTDITQLVKASKVNPDLVQELLKVRMIDSNGNDVPRFDSEEIARLVNASKDNPDLVQDLLKEKMIDSNGNDVPRFNGYNIETLVNASKDNPDLVQDLLKERTIDSNGNNVPRFNGCDIKTLVNISKDNPDLVQDLLKERTIDSDGNNIPRFDSNDIETMVSAYEENPDKVNELLHIKTLDSKGNPTFAFNSSDIYDFVYDDTNSDLKNKLLSIKIQDKSGNTYNLLSADEITNIVYMYDDAPDIL